MESIAYPGRRLANNEIRLIKIRPGAWDDPIQCDLHTFQHDLANYFALSYVWGSAGVSRTIFIGNQTYSITVNLERAMRYLRIQNTEEYLWIDALCINQQDVAERTHQVGMMDRIYMKCRKVIVFLGDRLRDKAPGHSSSVRYFLENDMLPPAFLSPPREPLDPVRSDVYEVFCFIQQLSSGKHLFEIPAFHQTSTTTQTTREVQDNDARTHGATDIYFQSEKRQQTRFFESLRRLMHGPSTPWWNRVWVIQEITLAPEADIVHGDIVAPWSIFAKAAYQYVEHARSCCSDVVISVPRDQAKVAADFSQRVSDVEELRMAYHSQQCTQSSETKSLLGLLRRFRNRQASDARDKVYALLGLVQTVEGTSTMEPDYSLNEVQVFAQATAECIESTGSLDLFNTELGRKFRHDLPSWVPDWSAPGGYSFDARAESLRLYKDVARGKLQFKLLRDLELAVVGKCIAQVTYVGEAMWGDVGNTIRDTLINLREVWKSEKPVANIPFWKIICADIICWPDGRKLAQRTEPESELKFMTWAICSKKSPFHSFEKDLDLLWSSAALAWLAILVLWPGKEVLDQRILRYASAKELIPSEFNVKEDIRLLHLRRLLHFLEDCFDAGQILDSSDNIREDAPWKDLLISVRKQFIIHYGENLNLNIRSYKDFTPVIDYSIVAATLSRRFTQARHETTGKLRYGLSPVETITGDLLFVMKGGRTSFVLRPKHEEPFWDVVGNDQPKLREELRSRDRYWRATRYQIIGDCYLEDSMDEKVTEGEWQDIVLV